MTAIMTELFDSWPYEQALSWMTHAHHRVAKHSTKIIIGCGSHTEKVVTVGRNVSAAHIDVGALQQIPHSTLHFVDRGGGVTAHEPGQLVLYPVINLRTHHLSVPMLIGFAQRAMLKFMSQCGVQGATSTSGPGVFIDLAKVGFVGMRIKEGISSHGLALNLLNDAQIFQHFAPCGMPGLLVTSLYRHASLSEPLSYYMELLTSAFVDELLGQ